MQPQTAYTYVVRTVDSAGNVSSNAVPLVVTTPIPLPPPPDTTAPTTAPGLRARVAGPTQVVLSWQPSTDAVGVTGAVGEQHALEADEAANDLGDDTQALRRQVARR